MFRVLGMAGIEPMQSKLGFLLDPAFALANYSKEAAHTIYTHTSTYIHIHPHTSTYSI